MEHCSLFIQHYLSRFDSFSVIKDLRDSVLEDLYSWCLRLPFPLGSNVSFVQRWMDVILFYLAILMAPGTGKHRNSGHRYYQCTTYKNWKFFPTFNNIECLRNIRPTNIPWNRIFPNWKRRNVPLTCKTEDRSPYGVEQGERSNVKPSDRLPYSTPRMRHSSAAPLNPFRSLQGWRV